MKSRREGEARRWALFAPTALAVGIALYFELSREPSAHLCGVIALCACGVASAAFFSRYLVLRICLVALSLAALGFAAAQWRAQSVAAPVWQGRGEVALVGRALALEQSADGAPRLLIDLPEIAGAAPGETPRKLRISFRRLAEAAPRAEARMRLRALLGRRIQLRARLFPPPGPAEPGAFDYRRRVWFEGVGALGSAESWPKEVGMVEPEGPADALSAWIDALRRAIAERARAAAEGPSGEIAAALLVGDRSGLPPEALDALRGSNLAHLLAISGLHMGIVCATVFALLRLIFALPAAPPSGLAPKKLAALAALAVGAGYLLLAGGAVATQRAFIMAAVVFGAVLVDRPAVTLRAIAAAALLILLLRPESLYEAGFQLSFAATTAMVAVFEAAGGWIRARRGASSDWRGRFLNAAAGVFVASLVAGLATAPFAAFAFNRLAPYGLFANLLAVPALGLWIMPAGLFAALLWPLGLDVYAFQFMALGVDYVLFIAESVSSRPGAVSYVKAGPDAALALIALGGLGLALWRGITLRLLGLSAALVGFGLWATTPRPSVLISEGGRRIGVMTAEGRVFDRPPVGDYASELWLRRDGEAPEAARDRRGFRRFEGGAVARSVEGLRVELSLAKKPDYAQLCAGPGVVIAPRAWSRWSPRADCLLFGRRRLRETGAVALYVESGGVRIRSASEVAGKRLWTDAATRRALLAAPDQSR